MSEERKSEVNQEIEGTKSEVNEENEGEGGNALKKRKTTTGKILHSDVEKLRRERLNFYFEELRTLVPISVTGECESQRKRPKYVILADAANYIRSLQDELKRQLELVAQLSSTAAAVSSGVSMGQSIPAPGMPPNVPGNPNMGGVRMKMPMPISNSTPLPNQPQGIIMPPLQMVNPAMGGTQMEPQTMGPGHLVAGGMVPQPTRAPQLYSPSAELLLKKEEESSYPSVSVKVEYNGESFPAGRDLNHCMTVLISSASGGSHKDVVNDMFAILQRLPLAIHKLERKSTKGNVGFSYEIKVSLLMDITHGDKVLQTFLEERMNRVNHS